MSTVNPFALLAATARFSSLVLAKLDLLFGKAAGGLAAATALLGSLVRLAHTGRIQQSLAFAVLGLAAAVAWLAWS